MTGLERALTEIDEPRQGAHEFSAMELYERLKAEGSTKTLASIRGILKRAVVDGKMTSRLVCIGGKLANLYSYKDENP